MVILAGRETRRVWMRWWPMILLLLAGASRWMLSGARPEAESSVGSQAAGCVWAALVCLALVRPRPANLRVSGCWRAALGGALMLCGPATGELLRATQIEPSAWMIALALTPVVVALAGRVDSAIGRIWPGLAAVAGLMLVLAQPSLADVRSDVALCLMPVLTGCGAALLSSEGAESSWRVPAALAGAALVFGLGWGIAWHVGDVELPSLLATACDGVLALLSLLVLVRLGAVRWSAQFALLPLLVLVQGIWILRPPLTLRWGVGLLLLVVASLFLLLPQAEDAEAAPAVVPR